MTAAVSAMLLAGCSKKVSLTFVNNTQTPMEIGLVNAGVDFGYEPIGQVKPMGFLRRELKMENEDLPATWSWKAEGQDGRTMSGQFVVDEDSKAAYTILLKTGRAYWRDKPQDVEYEGTWTENSTDIPQGEPEMVVE
jgi:hypothetical protein